MGIEVIDEVLALILSIGFERDVTLEMEQQNHFLIKNVFVFQIYFQVLYILYKAFQKRDDVSNSSMNSFSSTSSLRAISVYSAASSRISQRRKRTYYFEDPNVLREKAERIVAFHLHIFLQTIQNSFYNESILSRVS